MKPTNLRPIVGILGMNAFAWLMQTHCEAARLDLSGSWHFRLDPGNAGMVEGWYNQPLPQRIHLPGCLQEQGYGAVPGPDTPWWSKKQPAQPAPWLREYNTPDNFQTQHFLLPERHYIGAAWYGRTATIPDDWKGKRITLCLERCHWESRLWVDGRPMGQCNSLAAPHVYDLGDIAPGEHRLTLRIDNSEIVDLGRMAHSVSEQTAGTWNGIVGEIALRATDAVWIDHVQIFPNAAAKSVRMRMELGALDAAGAGTWKLVAEAEGGPAENRHNPAPFRLEGTLAAGGKTVVDFDYPLGDGMRLWDEFDPHLYGMRFNLEGRQAGHPFSASTSTSFGMRDFSVEGSQFAINGTTTFLRGNTDCAVMPKTGYAPMDVESWRKVWSAYKAFGLNMARFHSWCPPEAAFQAADEMGIYLAPEVGEWAKVETEAQFSFLQAESERILRQFGNHPSFVMLGLGNESGGDRRFFSELVSRWKKVDATRLYTIKANSGGNPTNMDYQVVRAVDKGVTIRYQDGWPPKPENSDFITLAPQTSIDWRAAVQRGKTPLVQHESAQFCAYPDIMGEMPKYTGYLKPSYLKIAQDQLRARGMLHQVPDFVEASGKWQLELTREEFEAAFRTPGLAGFNWLSLADFTGQDSAPVGFTDAFYDPKPYVDPAQVRRWNGSSVLLARMDKRAWVQSDRFEARIEASHYGKGALDLGDVTATLRTADGEVLKSWTLPETVIGQGSAQVLGTVSFPLEKVAAPLRLNLLVESPQNQLSNDWNLWVYPGDGTKVSAFPANVHLAHRWDEAVLQKLQQGGTVLLLPKIGTLKGNLPICFTTFYWTSFGTEGGQSSACGILLDGRHPLFKSFPTENHANWQWWDLLVNCQPMILDSYDTAHPWPKSFQPLVQPIDTWKINRKLALVAEAKVGQGKLLICSIDLETGLDERPATCQFRNSLIAYLQSGAFNPTTEVGAEAVAELFDLADSHSEAPGVDMDNLPTE